MYIPFYIVDCAIHGLRELVFIIPSEICIYRKPGHYSLPELHSLHKSDFRECITVGSSKIAVIFRHLSPGVREISVIVYHSVHVCILAQ